MPYGPASRSGYPTAPAMRLARTGTFHHWRLLVMPTTVQSSRNSAFHHQNGRCFYCGVRMWLRSPTELGEDPTSNKKAYSLRCTAEHLRPKSEGGADTTANIVAACARCNHTRHKRKSPPDPSRYGLDIRRRVARGAWHDSWVHERELIDLAARQ